MPEDAAVLVDLSFALAMAFIGGTIAVRLRQSPLLGYLVAGIVIGPFTPGFVGDPQHISALAEIGIIFLLFALGVEFSLDELRRVGRLALVGTALQLLLTGALGWGLGSLLGWDAHQALYLAAIVAMSSTVVVLKTLIARGEMESAHGRALLGMLIVQDLAAVALIVLLPPLTGNPDNLGLTLAVALGKAVLFITGALWLGRWVVPRLMDGIARLGSDELFILAVAAVAVGTAIAATALGLSTALGAFLAGLLVGRSEVEHRALAEVTPLRDLFTSLFFVSVGMLIDPRFALTHTWLVLLVAVAVVIIKGVVNAFVAGLPAFALSGKTALFVGVGLAQIGEFSYVLARQGVDHRVLVADQYSLVLSTSVLTIVVTPALFRAVPVLDRSLARLPLLGSRFGPRAQLIQSEASGTSEEWEQHVIVAGCGRVGGRVAVLLAANGCRVIGVDRDLAILHRLRQRGIDGVYGDAGYAAVLHAAHPERARALVVALPDMAAAHAIIRHVHAARPDLSIVARATTRMAARSLLADGASAVVEPAMEGGLALLRYALTAVGIPDQERDAIVAQAHQGELAGLDQDHTDMTTTEFHAPDLS